VLEEARKEVIPLIEEFRGRMLKKGIPEKAIENTIDCAEWELQRHSRKIKDLEIRKKFEVEYFKDFLRRYERWVESMIKILAE